MKQLLINGGPIFWILIVFSITGLTVALLKGWQFFNIRSKKQSAASVSLAHLKLNEQAHALMAVQNQSNPCARLMCISINEFDKSLLSLEDIKNECWRHARLIAAELQSHLRVLEVIATLAPLLGLFGTVLGMIEAFQAMELAGSKVNPAVLSGGISKALLTTAAGLAVAIPISLIHSWFERKVECITADMQNDLEQLFQIQTGLIKHHQVPSIAQDVAELA